MILFQEMQTKMTDWLQQVMNDQKLGIVFTLHRHTIVHRNYYRHHQHDFQGLLQSSKRAMVEISKRRIRLSDTLLDSGFHWVTVAS